MFKIIFFLWRADHLTPQAFADYYETIHAPLGIGLSPPMRDYRRNFPRWTDSTRSALGGFDVMTEIWHDRRSIFEDQLKIMTTTSARDIIAADEEKFIDRSRQLFVTVDEQPILDPLASSEAARSVRKYLRFTQKPDGVTLRDFQAQCETATQSVRADTGLIGFRRNHPLYHDEFSFSGGHHNMTAPEEGSRFFDLLDELWFDTQACLEGTPSLSSTTLPGSECQTIEVLERRSPGGILSAPVASFPI